MSHCSVFPALWSVVPIKTLPVRVFFLALTHLGTVGVYIFFCLSAYLITKLLYLEETNAGCVSVGAFYVRRILRIWPLYFFAIIVLQNLSTPFNSPFPGSTLACFCLFLGNWAMAFNGIPINCMFVLWSVSVEEQFYVVWPLLFRSVPPVARVKAFWALLAFAWLFRAAAGAYFQGSQHPSLVIAQGAGFGYSTFSHLDCFALGALLAVYEERVLKLLGGRRVWIIPVLLVWLLVGPKFLDVAPSLLTVSGFGLLALMCVTVVAGSLESRWLAHPVLVKLGRLTYGLYVFHYIVLRSTEYVLFGGRLPSPTFMPSLLQSILVSATALILTVLVASLSFRFLERPILEYKKRYTKVSSGAV